MVVALEAIEPNWVALIFFAGVWTVGCAGLFYLIGILPIGAAPAEVRRGAGSVLVVLNVALVSVLVVAALLFGLAELRWTSLVIAGGMVFLFAPFIIQDLPARLKDNKLGLSLLLVLTVSALVLLYLVGAVSSVRAILVE